jgi:hypothetical protein
MATTKTGNFLPAVFQSDANKKFLNATLDQLVTEPNLKPINGYIGRKFGPGQKSIDLFVKEPTADRADYQLEPSIVVKNPVTNQIEFNVTYPEVLQQIGYYGGKINNHDRLWSSEYYSYNPHINYDAFVNFSQYYWLPNGPDAVDVFAGAADLQKTYYVYPDNNTNVYNISGYSSISNPEIILARGGTYNFVVNQYKKKFYIQTDPGTSGVQSAQSNFSSRQVLGVSNNGDDVGTVTFNVPPKTAQDFYVNMTLVQNVDLVTTLMYSQIQGQSLATFNSTYNGIDGQTYLNGKYLIFGLEYTDDASWTVSTTVPASQRYGVWKIATDGGTINLTYVTSIPVNNKVVVTTGVVYAGTTWYTTSTNSLIQAPIITANLDMLYYQDSSNPDQYGIIKLVDPTNNIINVDNEIIGKQNYVSPNGITFTNGLKVKFDTSVLPVDYQDKEWYIEGVGTDDGISLTSVDSLAISYPGYTTNYNPTTWFANANTSGAPVTAKLSAAKDQLTITTTDIPDGTNILYGTFPNLDNTNYVVAQDVTLTYPYRGGQNTQGTHVSNQLYAGIIGVTLPGILIYAPSNGWYVPGSNGTLWHYDASQVLINGEDQYGGSPDNAGKYHYRDSTFITANAWGNFGYFTSNLNGYLSTDNSGHSKLIGWAADGYPIYGPFGYANPTNALSGAIRMTSSYTATTNGYGRPIRQSVTVSANVVSTNIITVSSTFGLNPGMRVTNNTAGLASGDVWILNCGVHSAIGPDQFTQGVNQIQLNTNVSILAGTSIDFEFLPGAFIEDYVYTGTGTLDRFNGRYCVTPEFPAGTYAYFSCQDYGSDPVYPYFVGSSFYGSLNLDISSSLASLDYITINRASRDLNPWTKRNRWFHKNVIDATAQYNNTVALFDQNQRANRPIIEFNPNHQLYDFGHNGLKPVDLFDNTITTPFLTVEGQQGLYIDGVKVVDGMRIIFAADQDPATVHKIWIANFYDQVGNSPNDPTVIHLHLEKPTDHDVQKGDTVSVLSGQTGSGKTYWYDGTAWHAGQTKTKTNQAPRFDVFDTDGISLGDTAKYPIANTNTAFKGTKIFSYKQGTGTSDTVLGFPLSYRNFNNVGDIEFENNFDNDTFVYTVNGITYNDKINLGVLYKNNADNSVKKLNVWSTVVENTKQYQDISYIYDGINASFTIDAPPAASQYSHNLLVFVNYKKISAANYQIYNIPNNSKLITINAALLKINDRVDLLVYSDSISKLGYYQVPDNLNLNAKNSPFINPTLGEIRNHVGKLVESSLKFAGPYPGASNIRDIKITNRGGTIVQQSAPTSYASMFLCNNNYNFVDSLASASHEYTRFKNKFLTLASHSNNINYSNPAESIDIILEQINISKNKSFPWYYSDMFPYGANKKIISYTIFDPAQRNYEITNLFTNNELSNKAVLVYVNGTQLVYGKDYTFLTQAPGISFTSTYYPNVGDILTIDEYYDTDGCYVPETPSKLGLYPKYYPEIITDYTYIKPQTFIVGHDGSLTPTFGDFRDDLILELEKRIYNNIKVDYDPNLLNIYDNIPGKFRDIGYSLTEYNAVLTKSYLQWVGQYNLDYITNSSYQFDVPFTYNYGSAQDVIDGEKLQGSWRACFEYFYDTTQPHTHPWEMLGFSEKPAWWEDYYGPAPYTGGNTVLWTDLQNGYIADGERKGIDPRFARPGLLKIIPVSENGDLKPPIGLLTQKYDLNSFDSNWQVGQYSPTEAAWRNSSDYPFALQYISALIHPAKYFALGIATSKYKYNTQLDQYLVSTTNQRLAPADIDINGYITSGVTTRSSSYINWISDYLTSLGITNKTDLLNYIRNYNVQLSYRMAGFSGKQYFKVLAEQNSPNSTNESILIPDADINLVLNKSTPIENARYSAIIIEKRSNGWQVSGYDNAHPYFVIAPPVLSGSSYNVTTVKQSVKYYEEFVDYKVIVPYGTTFTNFQQVASFIAGYERYLSSLGFLFDSYDADLGEIRNWALSAKEFLFWVQQGWPVDSILVLNPSGDTIKFRSAVSTVDTITNSFYGSKVMTQNYVVLDSDSYSVIRQDNNFIISIDSKSGNMIGLLDIKTVQYEHVLIFENTTQFNDIIYDPTVGQRQFKLKLIGNKTTGWTGTFAPPGFVYNKEGVPEWMPATDYLRGDLIEYKNFYYSANKNLPGTDQFDFKNWLPVDKNKIKTGLLNNFARNSSLSKNFYNVDKVNLESEFDLFGLGLIGYRNRNYLNDLALDDVTQVKFYQGFIKEKGTANAIDALGRVKIGADQTSYTIAEEWAFRVGAYGSLETNQFVELVLDEQYVLNNPTSLEVVDNHTVTYSSLYKENFEIYKTSNPTWTPPFLLNRTSNSLYVQDLKSTGFVNIEDVDYTIFDLANLSTFNGNIADINVGSTIWTATDYAQDWNVFIVNTTNVNIIEVANALDNKLQFTTNLNHGLAVDDIVMVTGYKTYNGFYRISYVPSLTTFIANYSGSLTGFSKVTGSNPVYKLVSMRLDYASQIGSYTPPNGWFVNNKAWINEGANSQWAVYNKSEPWEFLKRLPQSMSDANVNYGSAVKISSDGTFAVIGQPGYKSNIGAVTTMLQSYTGDFYEGGTISTLAANAGGMGSSIDFGLTNVLVGAPTSSSNIGYVVALTKDFTGTLTTNQILTANVASSNFGTSISLSDDEQWLYVGAPGAGKVYVYAYDNSVPALSYTIAPANAITKTFTLNFTPASQEFLYVARSTRDYVPNIDFTISANTITFATNTGLGNIVVRQNPGYRYITSIAHPNASSQFGYSVASSTDGAQVVIGAPLANIVVRNTSGIYGSVSVYDRSIENFIAGANQKIFTTKRSLLSVSKVYVDKSLKTLGVDYVVTLGNQVTFITAPHAGAIISIETNQFNKIQESAPDVSYSNQQFGYSVDLCPLNCSVYAGAPYQSGAGVYNGAVYRLVNQGKVYGNVICSNVLEQTTTISTNVAASTANVTVSSVSGLTVGMYLINSTSGNISSASSYTISSIDAANKIVTLNKNVTGQAYVGTSLTFAKIKSGDSIRINNYEVTFSDTRLSYIVSAINSTNIPGVTAIGVSGQLALVSDSTLAFDKLNLLPGVGTALADIGANVFVQTQLIINNNNHSYDYFGKKVKINNNSDVLFVGSDIANTLEPTTFDVTSTITFETTFDGTATKFKDYIQTSGSVWTFSYLPDSRNSISYPGAFNFVEQLTPYPGLKSKVGFGHDIDVNTYNLIVGSYTDNTYNKNTGVVYQFKNTDGLNGWDVIRYGEPKVDISCLLKNYVYSASSQTILYNLDYIDPLKGKILGVAEQDITYKTDYDPAVYNVANATTVSSSTSLHWNDMQVGQVWWDLSTVRFIDYEQGSIKYRTTNWGRLFPGSSVDIYEWVESIYPPSQYIAKGGDGEPKYGDNAAFSTLIYVDPNTNIPVVTYYYWVKNKTTVTVNQFGRQIPTTAIASYIENPKSSGIKYLAALRDDSVAVYNLNKNVTGKDIILHIDYATQLNNNIIHSEYALVPEKGGKASDIPKNIYNKLVDSVSGQDLFGNPVPDSRLPVQNRYGIEIRPRQSIFVDRLQAVKEMVTYVNTVFANNIISQGFDLTGLSAGEPIPTAGTNVFDLSVNTYEELTYLNIIIQPAGYRVLVVADSTINNLWSIYTKQSNNTWLLTRVQSYRTSDYWEYVDWYTTGFDKTTKPKYTVNTYADLSTLSLRAQDVVKVLNNGQGKWLLLQIFPNIVSTVGIQSGTIALTENLYNLVDYGMGFGNDNFDTQRFDQNPSIELRNILTALRNDLFINQLRENFLELFYVFIYYVLDEQKYVDWVFKTSFINVLHKFRGLNQPQIYSKDNQEYYKQYIEEVKPYKTTIREYVLDYQGKDNLTGYVTDFDVPPFYDTVLGVYRSPSGTFIQDATQLQSPQYRDWLLTYDYHVSSIIIENSGSGYTQAPIVTITGSSVGNDAVARALISNGQVSKIEILYGGSNYITQPTVVLSGGNGTGALAYAKLANDTVRKIKTTLVYDRITYGTTVLDWSANTSYNTGTIISYNGVGYVVNSNFTSGATFIGNYLTVYPAYKFNTANDRIQAYYNPPNTLPGKDPALLQSGINYPGVVIDGLLFTDTGGFGVAGFDSSPFDPFDIDSEGNPIISGSILDSVIQSSYTDTSLGVRPEDIIIDGGGYVDTYSSRAPEELIPGRVFDTLDMTVTTFATNAAAASYTSWTTTNGLEVTSVEVVNGGLGYNANTISVRISGTTGTGTTVKPALNANGTIISFSIISQGTQYTTIPNVIITGSNVSPAVATAILTQNDYPTFSYKIFKDMNDNYGYYRVSANASTNIVSTTSNTITVANSTVLSMPNLSGAVPGVIFVNGERITYWTNNTSTNTLSNIRRATLGTGVSTLTAGAAVYDESAVQLVPYSDNYTWTPKVDTIKQLTSTSYALFKAGQTYITSNLWYDTGYGASTISVEIGFNVGATENLITTETPDLLTTQSTYSSPTNGLGLYVSSQEQAIFIRE